MVWGILFVIFTNKKYEVWWRADLRFLMIDKGLFNNEAYVKLAPGCRFLWLHILKWQATFNNIDYIKHRVAVVAMRVPTIIISVLHVVGVVHCRTLKHQSAEKTLSNPSTHELTSQFNECALWEAQWIINDCIPIEKAGCNYSCML